MEKESCPSKLFWIVVGVFSIFLSILFYCEATGRITSDLIDHMQAGAANHGYSLLHRLFYPLSQSSWYEVWVSLVLTLCVIATLLITRQLLVENVSPATGNRHLVDFFSCTLLMVSMIVLPGIYRNWYLGQGSPNPWHNPTYILCRLFGVVTVLFFIRVYKKGLLFSLGNLLCFAVSLALASYAKPSFPSIFMPAVMTLLLADWWWYRKRETVIMIFGMGLLFLPSIAIVLLQSLLVFDGGGALTLIFGRSWTVYSKHVFISILLAFFFPLFVGLTSRSRNPLHIIGLLSLIYGAFFFTFMGETGERATHLNMAWGLSLGQFLAFIACAATVMEKWASRRWARCAMGLYIIHLVSGVLYMGRYLLSGSYS